MEKPNQEINQKNNFLNIEVRELLDKINSKVSRTTSRSMNFYKELLWININDLENQKILNVGAWDSELNKELEKNWIEPSIFINTDLKAKSWVKSDMRNLPFSEESFDKLLYLWSLPWILYKEEKNKAINEALRVTKELWDIMYTQLF